MKTTWSSHKMQKKFFDAMEHPFMINFLNIIRTVYPSHQPTSHKTHSISLKSRRRWGYSLPPNLFHILLEIVARTIRKLKGINGIQIEGKEIKGSLFADIMTVYISDPKISTIPKEKVKSHLGTDPRSTIVSWLQDMPMQQWHTACRSNQPTYDLT